MKRLTVIFVLIWTFGTLGQVFGQSIPTLSNKKTLSSREWFSRSWDHNVLKIFDTAVDEENNLIYVSGIMTPHLAVVDGNTGEVIRTVDSGNTSNTYKYLYYVSSSNSLYMHLTVEQIVRRYDTGTGDWNAVDLNVGESMNIEIDTKRNRLYRTSRREPFIVVYDAITLEEITSDCPACLGVTEGAGRMIYDETTDLLHILDIQKTGGEAVINIVDPDSLEVVETVSIPMMEGLRPLDFALKPDGDYIISTAGDITLFGSDGTQKMRKRYTREYEYEHFEFDTVRNEVYGLFLEVPSDGKVDGTRNRLVRYNALNLAEISSIEFGRKAHRLSLNSRTGKIYVPNGDASVVWEIDVETSNVDAVRIGDSLENFAGGIGGSPIYINSRLGGNYVLSYDPVTEAVETFEAGTWPIPIISSDNGEFLYLLNAWDSTFSIYRSTPVGELVTTIALDLPPGSTDQLPEMTIDHTQKKAYVFYPEFSKMAVVDIANERSEGNYDLTSFFTTYSDSGGPGLLQGQVIEQAGKLFIYAKQDHNLAVYDVRTTPVLESTISLRDVDWKVAANAPGTGWFFYEGVNNRLFLGPYEIDLSTGNLTGSALPGLSVLFAHEPERNLYWGLGQSRIGEAFYSTVVWVDSNTRTLLGTSTLRERTTVAPNFFLDSVRKKFYVSYMAAAEIDVYNVDGGTNVFGWMYH